MTDIFSALSKAVGRSTPEKPAPGAPAAGSDEQTRRLTASDIAKAQALLAVQGEEEVTEMTLAVTGTRPQLRLVSGEPGTPAKFFLSAAGVTTIGRAPDNDVVLAGDAASSHHCRIDQQGKTFTLTDLGSTNKTLVNGTETEKAVLRNGDEITVGTSKLVFALFGDRA